MRGKIFCFCVMWMIIGTSIFAQQPWSLLFTGDIINTNAGNIGIGTTTPAAKVHIKGNKDWGLIVQNNNSTPTEPFNESTFMVREPLSDNGNFFSLVVGSGPTSAVELAALRASDGTGRTIDIHTGKWSWMFGGARYINFDANGVVGFGTTASTVAGKQVEIRASTPKDDALRIQGISFQSGKLVRLLSDFGNELFNVNNDGKVGIGTANPTANLHVVGNFVATGSKSALVETPSFGKRKLYALESPENWFEDFGNAQLRNGQAVVFLDEVFAQTVNTEMMYHVFLTPNGNCSLFVSEKAHNHFKVHLFDGASDCRFDYRIVAKRQGFERARLEEVR